MFSLISCNHSSISASNSDNLTSEPTVEPTQEKIEVLKYKLNEDKTSYAVTGYNERTEEVIIPDYYNDLPVTEIAQQAFYGCRTMNKLTIGANVEKIWDEAFYGCNIENIVIPESVALIANKVFSSCENLKEVILPDDMSYIFSGAFSYCSSLKSITIPQNVTTIGESAFSGITTLEEVILSDKQQN